MRDQIIEFAAKVGVSPGIVYMSDIRGSKWKAKWIDTHPSLTDYIATSQIIVPWKEQKRFLNSAVEHHNHDVRRECFGECNMRQLLSRPNPQAQAMKMQQ